MARYLLGIIGLAAFAVNAEAQDLGKSVYEQHCLTCHQADGYGVPYMQPPLVDSPILNGPKEGLIAFVMTGNQGPSEWDNPMGSFAFLSNEEMAAVLTYVRENFGEGGAVSPGAVADVRDIIGD